MENSKETVELLKSINQTLTIIAWILGMGLGIALNAGYRAGVFGWVWN